MAKIGPREAELRRMREQALKHAKTSKPVMGFDIEPPTLEELFEAKMGIPFINKETTAVKKPTKKIVKKTSKKKPVSKPKAAAKKKAPPAAKKPKASGKKGVSAQDVADFICQPGGASMAELEAKFGIDAHPMRAKIYYIRNTLEIAIESKDGRYFGPPAKA